MNYDVHVHELGTWNINIVDETLDSSDNIDVNGLEKVEDFVDKNSLADLNDLKETINELASNEIQHPISKKNIDQEDYINNVSPEIGVSSDLSRPLDSLAKAILWNRIADFMHQHAGKYIIFRDMNVVHNENERSGSLFSRQDADNFNSFIENFDLIDFPLGDLLFTWMNKTGTKLSKLDRFLISKEVVEALPDVHVTAIDRLWSDHNPILLHVSKFDFGPMPFKLFHSWLLHDSFDEVIKMELPKLEEHNFRRKLLSHEKFRILKARIKQWHFETKTSNRVTKHDNLQLIKSIEEKIKADYANDDDRHSCIKLLQKVDRLDTFESFDLFQKTHVKWDIEGDENSKNFHGMIKQKRRAQMIHCIEKFKDHDSNVDFPSFSNSSGLCDLDRDSLETLVSLEEVKNAVWDCGSSKAPGPDGFSFAFVKKYWDDIKVGILEFFNIFLDTSSLPHGSNSSFFTLIPKVSNPIFIKDFRPISLISVHYKIIAKILANRLTKVIDKIASPEQSTFIAGRQIFDSPKFLMVLLFLVRLSNGSKKEKKLLIFKVDFEKAFDSVSWKYLDFVLLNLGFGSKWLSWIRVCLSSSRASVLVNGSPISEFSVKRGLRQGDHLSPFLFILVIEGLHSALSIVVSSGLIRGVKFSSPKVFISHLFYADDVIITSEWNANDLDNIIRVLQVFYLASGLKINIQKSNVYGIGDSDVDVSFIASNSGCAPGSFSFTYLGLPVGSNMSLTSSWQVLLDSFAEISEVEDSCVWSLGTDGTSSVKDARCIIESKILPSLAPLIVWDKNIPQKVNIFILRLILDRLPHKLNLSSRGFDIQAISCPSFNGNVESPNHIFFECNIAKDIWMLIRKWCITTHNFHKCKYPSIKLDDVQSISKEKSRRLSVIFSSSLWWLWRYRNNVTFRSHPMRKSDIFDSIRLSSYSWLHHRGHMICNWID
ncbi:putative RNA-directed DNA polymerase, eukaryota, reverse transcriptase zinc-binding domain protein [Tanacetum coccineum]